MSTRDEFGRELARPSPATGANDGPQAGDVVVDPMAVDTNTGMRADGSVEPSLRGTGQGGIGLRSGPHVVCCLLPHPSSSHCGTILSEHGYCTGAENSFDSFRKQRSNNYHTRLERVFGSGAPKPGGNRERDRDRDRERRS